MPTLEFESCGQPSMRTTSPPRPNAFAETIGSSYPRRTARPFRQASSSPATRSCSVIRRGIPERVKTRNFVCLITMKSAIQRQPPGIEEVKTKSEIVKNWLPRYTDRPLAEFGKFILLSNFASYIDMFAANFNVDVIGRSHPMQSATAEDLTIVNFGMGSAMAATVMDLLAAVEPKAVLFLGKCGGLKKTKVGDYILPIAAIRGEGTSNDYMPPEIPALPSFRLQKAVSAMIVKHGLDYSTGTVYTTNRRVWEHDDTFREYLTKIRVLGIDMETATIFIVGFVNHIP